MAKSEDPIWWVGFRSTFCRAGFLGEDNEAAGRRQRPRVEIRSPLLRPCCGGVQRSADEEFVELLARWASGTSALCGGVGRPHDKDDGCLYEQ
jgi:hypothetical protein